MYLSLKFLASILIKVIEEFCIVWLNSSLFFFLIGLLMEKPHGRNPAFGIVSILFDFITIGNEAGQPNA